MLGRDLSFAACSMVLAACGPRTEIIDLAPAQLELSATVVDFGLAPTGETVDRQVVLSNPGDVPLGVDTITLWSSVDPLRGHAGEFSLRTDCGGFPADTGAPGDSGDTAERPVGVGSRCAITPGGQLVVDVRYQPTRAGPAWDSLVVNTYGDDTSDPAVQALSIEDRNYRDLHHTWRQVYLTGEGHGTAPRATVVPRTLDLGFVYAEQVERGYITIRNSGDGQLRVVDVAPDSRSCTAGFDVVAPEAGTTIRGGQAEVIEVRYASAGPAEAWCRLRIRTDDPTAPSSETVDEITVVANAGRDPANVPPTVVLHSPEDGYQHVGSDPVPVELTVLDNEPATSLTCEVRSGLGRPGSVDCRPPDSSGRVVVDWPVDVDDPGVDVLVVRVTDASGATTRASASVLLNTAYPDDDADRDGFSPTGPGADCDDARRTVHVGAAEVADGLDNDCDGVVDEETVRFDDDGDGMTEADGDCDDTDADTYRGAPEIHDRADNDCDGIVDENTTGYDDDGDGYSELDGDCDDRDPRVHRGAREVCDDGRDNDCDGTADDTDPEGCVGIDGTPMIVGRLDLSPTSIEVGESVSMFLQVYEPDGDEVTYAWEVRDAAGAISDPTSPSASWSAPTQISDPSLIGEIFTIYASASDPDGNQAWTYEQVWMYAEGDLQVPLAKEVEVPASCHTAGSAPGVLFVGVGLLLVGLRRRRSLGPAGPQTR